MPTNFRQNSSNVNSDNRRLSKNEECVLTRSEFQIILEKLNSMEEKLSTRMTNLENVQQAQGNKLDEHIINTSNCVTAIDNNVNENTKRFLELDYKVHQCDLQITGIPKQPDENLHGIFDKICKFFDFKLVLPLESIFRISTKRNTSIVIVKFSTKMDRMEFYKKYRTSRINVSNIDIDGNHRIYINEYVNPVMKQVFNKAFKYSKEENSIITNIKQKGGLVYITLCSDSSSSVFVPSISFLDELITLNRK